MDSFMAQRNNCRRHLIMLVKKHPILWNKQVDDYKRNRQRKLQTWYTISKEMGSTADKIRRTWENLRDQYRRDLKREMKYGYKSKWRFFSDMQFIRHMVNCKDSQIEVTDSDSELDTSEAKTSQFSKPITKSTNIHDSPSTSGSSSKVTEFQPIRLSKQWQTTNDVEQNGGQQLTLEEFVKAFGDTPPTLNTTQLCDSSRNISRTNNVNHEAPKNLVEEQPLKVEPKLEIEIEDTRIDLQPNNSFQESLITTSNSRPVIDLTEQPLEVTSEVPQKNLNRSESEVDFKDDDYYFVMSLLPSLRQIPRNRKLALRIGLMNLIAENMEDVNK